MGPIRLRPTLALWVQLASMWESRPAGSWRGAYLHPPPVRHAARLPALTWGQVALLALASALVPTSCSAGQDARSLCSRFLSRGRLASTCLLEFQVSRLPWPNEDTAKSLPQPPSRPGGDFDELLGQEPVIRGRSMTITVKLLAKLGLLPLLAILSVGSVSAQTDIGKTVLEKLTARVARLESACAKDIKKYCKTVTPGEGRMIYCMQAHENKISVKCAFERGETSTGVQITADALKEAVIACKAEISGVCGKTLPGQGRIAACLLSNKSTASAGCVEAIQKIESMATQ